MKVNMDIFFDGVEKLSEKARALEVEERKERIKAEVNILIELIVCGIIELQDEQKERLIEGLQRKN